MLRLLYRGLLRLHPPAFRRHFAEEMLSIFDQVKGRGAAFILLLDSLISFARQWALRPEFWHEISPAPQQELAADDVPSFCTLGPFRPKTYAIIHGLVLSMAIFSATCFAIRYSWIHVLHVRIPEVVFESPSSIEPRAGVVEADDVSRYGSRSRGYSHFEGSSRRPSRSKGTLPAPPVAQSQPANGRSAQRGQSVNASAQAISSLDSVQSRPPGWLRSETRQLPTASQATVADSAIQSPASEPLRVQEARIDAAERRFVVDSAIANLKKYYVDPDAAEKMADSLRAHKSSGDDDAATDGGTFADLLTQQMRDASHDKYVAMVYSTVAIPENPPAPTADDTVAYRRHMERSNCNFERVAILPHNIGYLKFNSFPDAAICGRQAAAAMAKLNNTDAIIFDLRENPGGYANMVAFLATYLFDRPTHLNDFYSRGDNTTEQSWTLPPVPGNKLADKPAFVLISHSTFSAAEGFSYDLKMLKRATLVGEATSGRGHMGMAHRIDDHFTIRIPAVRVTNPISGTNWEGTGVEPDVKVRSADALATAEKLAERKLQAQ